MAEHQSLSAITVIVMALAGNRAVMAQVTHFQTLTVNALNVQPSWKSLGAFQGHFGCSQANPSRSSETKGFGQGLGVDLEP